MKLVLLSTDALRQVLWMGQGRARTFLAVVVLSSMCLITACTQEHAATLDKAGPLIGAMTTSTKSFSIDCTPTAVTVTARVTDPAGLRQVQLWYRVGTDRAYQSVSMAANQASEYQATIQGPRLPPDRYGALELYITAEDQAGNRSKSATDTSVQFLPCVSH